LEYATNRNVSEFGMTKTAFIKSQRRCGLRSRSAAASLPEIVGSNPAENRDVFCECCVLSGRGLCDEQITRPEESYQLWCFVVCDLETSRMRRPWPALGRSAKKQQYLALFQLNYAFGRTTEI